MKTKFAIFASLCLLGLTASLSPAGSIWNKNNVASRRGSLIADDKAARIGDVLTIQIVEKSKIDNKRKKTDSRASSTNGTGSGNVDFGGLLGFKGLDKLFEFPSYDYTGSSTTGFNGKSDTLNDKKFTDVITVLVEDVMPNGNLLVLGKRVREINGNKQIVQVSGIVRPSDITAANMISSARVANFSLVYLEKGRDNNYMKPGWMLRIWNMINPI